MSLLALISKAKDVSFDKRHIQRHNYDRNHNANLKSILKWFVILSLITLNYLNCQLRYDKSMFGNYIFVKTTVNNKNSTIVNNLFIGVVSPINPTLRFSLVSNNHNF